jgi:hypothetical protein
MKNYLVILFFVFLASVGNVNAQGGGNCSAAAAAPVTLPFSASNQNQLWHG